MQHALRSSPMKDTNDAAQIHKIIKKMYSVNNIYLPYLLSLIIGLQVVETSANSVRYLHLLPDQFCLFLKETSGKLVLHKMVLALVLNDILFINHWWINDGRHVRNSSHNFTNHLALVTSFGLCTGVIGAPSKNPTGRLKCEPISCQSCIK